MGSTSHTNRVFKGRYINQVSKTQFLGGHRMEKVSPQTRTEHENRVLKT